MAWPDIADIRTQIRSLLNEKTAAFWTDAELNRLINEAERDIAAKALCLEAIATVTASTRTTSFTGHKILRAEYNAIGLQKILPKMMGRVTLNGVVPQYWFQWGQTLVLEPKPATSYTITLYTAIAPSTGMGTIEGTADTNEPSIPARFHELIILFVLSRAYMKDRKFTTAGHIYKTYINELMIARKQVIDRYADPRSALKVPDRIVTAGGE